MPRTPYLIQDRDGNHLGVLVSIRERWRPKDTLVLKAKKYRVEAVVLLLEPDDSTGCVSVLTVQPSL